MVTAEEFAAIAADEGVKKAAKKVDVVTTGTFGPMCSQRRLPQLRALRPAHQDGRRSRSTTCRPAAGSPRSTRTSASPSRRARGASSTAARTSSRTCIRGHAVRLKATGPGTDCYPRTEIDTWVTLEDLNQAYFFNPRNAYQNYAVAVNSTDRALYTYLGPLLPRFGNATFCSAGALSPLLNDPTYRTIGVGTRCFVAGAPGYVAWQGTQHNPNQTRDEHGVPVAPAGTLAVIADLKQAQPRVLLGGDVDQVRRLELRGHRRADPGARRGHRRARSRSPTPT